MQAHLRRNKLGKYDPEREAQLQLEREAQAVVEAELASKMKVGDRCEVAVPGQPIKRGQVMFIG